MSPPLQNALPLLTHKAVSIEPDVPSSAILANYMSIQADGAREEVWKRAETASTLGKKKIKRHREMGSWHIINTEADGHLTNVSPMLRGFPLG